MNKTAPIQITSSPDRQYLTPARRSTKHLFTSSFKESFPSHDFANAKTPNAKSVSGFSFGTSKRNTFQPSETPAPNAYNVSATIGKGARASSMGKSNRPPLLHESVAHSPGPIYNTNRRLSASGVIFTHEPRFHSTAGKGQQTPGPADHHIQESIVQHTTPSYSFGQRYNDKLYFSKSLNRSVSISPTAKYNIRDTIAFIQETPLSCTFGFGSRPPLSRVDNTPGPDAYSPNPNTTKEPRPVFGNAPRNDKVYVSDSLSNFMGLSSPGPTYNPSDKKSSRIQAAPTFSFAKETRGKTAVIVPGRDTPGPGAYNPEKLDLSHKFTIQGKEAEAEPSLIEGTKKLRHISNSHNVDALGVTPGPKYNIASTIGSGVKNTIPRAGIDHANMHDVTGKLYLGNNAKNIVAKGHYSPGPVYNIAEVDTSFKPKAKRIISKTEVRGETMSKRISM